jgi:hypothetical protein
VVNGDRGVLREWRIALYSYDNHITIRSQCFMARERPLALEERTARLTILIDPRKKAVLERLCAEEDTTPSQVVRRLLRAYIEERTGKPWTPDEAHKAEAPKKSRAARGG